MNLEVPADIIKKYNIELFIVFGSYAENMNKPGSDLDLAYKSFKILSKNEEIELLNELSQFYQRGDLDLVNLSKATIEANSRFFKSKEEVPKKAISMGMATILKADRIVLLASGKNKAEAIKDTVSGKISTKVPASLLQTHPEITVLLDQEAASLISKEELSADCHFIICD